MSRYLVGPAIGGRDAVWFGDLKERRSDPLYLGRLSEVGPARDVIWDASGETVFSIFGKRGSGKSFSLGVILEGLAATAPVKGYAASSSRATLLFDTLGIFWTLARPFTNEVLKRPDWQESARQLRRWGLDSASFSVKNVVPAGFRRPGDLVDIELTVAPSSMTGEDWCDLLDLDPFEDRMGQLLMHSVETAGGQQQAWQLSDLIDVIREDPAIQGLYATETCRGLAQRLSQYASLELFTGPGTPLVELMQPGSVTVLSMSALSDELRRLLVSVLMRKVMASRSGAAAIEKRIRFDPDLSDSEKEELAASLGDLIAPSLVVVDEAQNVLPSERNVKSSAAIVKFVREGRNHGLSFGLTTQQPSAVDQRILAQVDTMFCHKLTVATDIRRVQDNLKTRNPAQVKLGASEVDFEGWVRSLDVGQCVVSQTDAERNFALDFRPRLVPHAGSGF